MNMPFNPILVALITTAVCVQAQTSDSGQVRVVIDDNQPGWRVLLAEDFSSVNCPDNTWSWKEDVLHCTGQPIGVLRTKNEYKNFEMAKYLQKDNLGFLVREKQNLFQCRKNAYHVMKQTKLKHKSIYSYAKSF